jgi:pimeloyl-ACP methyl ester carboxylesterase
VNLSVERRHLTIGHRTLSYLAAGPRSGTRTVVLLHAFPLNAAMWVSQLRALPDGWTGLAPDFRGFGGSTPDDEDAARADARIEDYADDVMAMLDEVGAPRAALGGCSMGGYAAFAVLRRAPGRVAGLLLADTRAAADTDAARASRAAMLDLVDRDGPAGIAAEMRPKLVGPTTREGRPDVLATVDTLMDVATARGIGFAVARMRNRPDATADLAAYLGPVSVVVGEEDTLTPHPEASAMAAAVPGAAFVRIAGAGHLPNLEAPEAFNVAMHGWLRSIDGVAVGQPNPQFPIPNPTPEC